MVRPVHSTQVPVVIHHNHHLADGRIELILQQSQNLRHISPGSCDSSSVSGPQMLCRIWSEPSLPPDNSLECCLEFSEYGSSRRRRAKVNASQLCHESFPHSFPTLFKKLRANGQLPGCRSVPPSPRPHVSQQ